MSAACAPDGAPMPGDEHAPFGGRPLAPLAKATGADWSPPMPIGRDAAPPPFPVAELPRWIGDFVTSVAESTSTPLDLVGCFALGALSASTQGKIKARPWAGFEVHANLWICVAADPGELKGPTHAFACRPLVDAEKQLREQAAPAQADAAARRRVLEKRLKSAEDRAAKDDSAMADVLRAQRELDACEVPHLPRLLVDDVTPETLKTLLARHGSLAVVSAESGFFGNVASQRYSRNVNIEAALESYSGGRINVDRRDREERIEGVVTTLAIAVQPGLLTDAFKNEVAKARGLFDRFLYSMPRSAVGSRPVHMVPPPPDSRALHEWNERIQRAAVAASRAKDVAIDFSPEARDAYVAWRGITEPRWGETGDLVSLKGWGGKAHGTVAKLAALLWLADAQDDATAATVSAHHVERAVRVWSYFLAHAQIAFDVGDMDEATSRAVKVRRWFRERLASHGPTFTRGEAQVAFKGRLTADELSPALRLLEQLGYLRSVRAPAGPAGGRPVERFEVNPLDRVSGVTGVDP